MSRKSLWFVSMLTFVIVGLIGVSVGVHAQKQKYVSEGPPSVSVSAEPAVVRACADAHALLTAAGRSSSGAPLRYRWTVNGGRLTGQGPNPSWDLAGLQPGVYQAVVEVDEGNQDCVAFSSVSVVMLDCPPPPPVCPTVSVVCPEAVTENAPLTFTAQLAGGTPGITATYNWTVSAGRVIDGQGTPHLTVDTTGLAGQTVRATLDIGGFGMSCPASCAVTIPVTIVSHKFDEYYDIARNDEKARLDNYAIELQRDPTSQGYVIVYPSRKAKPNQAQARSQRIVDYLVNTRGIDTHHLTVTMGPAREDWLFELWVVPAGAQPPTPQR